VSYDYERATLIDDVGVAHNYLTFLLDYLKLVRTLGYAIDLLEVSTTLDERRSRAISVDANATGGQ
jgi:hypothetical protein